jgi:hypothetical protein
MPERVLLYHIQDAIHGVNDVNFHVQARGAAVRGSAPFTPGNQWQLWLVIFVVRRWALERQRSGE